MNLKLTLTLTLVFALMPLLAIQHGFRPGLDSGGAWTRGWQEQGEAMPDGLGLRYDCIVTGADLLRRAAPPVVGESANPSWTPPSTGLTSRGKLACSDS
jgi:hypothetical protein